MNVDAYDDTDLDPESDIDVEADDVDLDLDEALDFDSGIAGFEIAYGSINKKAIRKTAKQKHRIRQKLDSLREKRYLERQVDTLSDYWDR